MYGDVVWKHMEEKINGLKCMSPVWYEYCSPLFTNFYFRGVAAFVKIMYDINLSQIVREDGFLNLTGDHGLKSSSVDRHSFSNQVKRAGFCS